MKDFHSIPLVTLSRWLFVLAICLAPQVVRATTWQAISGAQSTDEGIQALAFLSNELWIHAGDSITWTFPTPEIHTVTFLKPGQIRPPRPGVAGGGCPGTTRWLRLRWLHVHNLQRIGGRADLHRDFSNGRKLQARLPGA
jgi:plastocyanin